MKNKSLGENIRNEIKHLVTQRQSLMLSSLTQDGLPYASYAPFAVGCNCFYILISDIAVHAKNLQWQPHASVLIIEDEETAAELFARVRIFYWVKAEMILPSTADWQQGINCLRQRHGERITNLSQLTDFRLFQLHPISGRYVKGFGKAYQIDGGTLTGEYLSQLRGGHRKRDVFTDYER